MPRAAAQPPRLKRRAHARSRFFGPPHACRSNTANLAVDPVVAAIGELGIQKLVLSLNGVLHLFPFHACKLPNGMYLGQEYEVAYTPSLSLLYRCARRQRKSPRNLLLISNPAANLPFTELEGQVVEARFRPPAGELSHVQANMEALLKESVNSHVFHFSGHSHFDAKDPLNSGLILMGADQALAGNSLTLRDVYSELNLEQNTLAVLSGCESGRLLPDRTDDYASLPLGFLYAGAKCVVSTLWQVDDLATALLIAKYYELWHDEAGNVTCSPAAALRGAQRWLRDDIRSGNQLAHGVIPPLIAQVDDADTANRCWARVREYERRYRDSPPFVSPAYWAPFICNGMGF